MKSRWELQRHMFRRILKVQSYKNHSRRHSHKQDYKNHERRYSDNQDLRRLKHAWKSTPWELAHHRMPSSLKNTKGKDDGCGIYSPLSVRGRRTHADANAKNAINDDQNQVPYTLCFFTLIWTTLRIDRLVGWGEICTIVTTFYAVC
jgi:hypothetical protein